MNNNYEPQFNTNQSLNNNETVQPVKKTSLTTKILAIIGGIVVAIIIIFIIVFLITSKISNKLVCKSNEGNITIMYNDESITGYNSNGITYDMDVAKKAVKQVGMDDYIKEFEKWFETNTTGTCTVEKR